jgi:uncharacterized protein (DUF58 family)
LTGFDVHPPLAHVLSGGGPLNVVLLLSGALAAVAGVQLRERKPSAASLGRVLTVVGIVAFGLGLVIDAGPAPTASDATVRIVLPSPGSEVPADRPIDLAVDLENGSLALSEDDTNGGHLHLFVDGQVRRMPYSTEAEITLTPGPHEIRVEFVDYRHRSFRPEVSTTIRVTAV